MVSPQLLACNFGTGGPAQKLAESAEAFVVLLKQSDARKAQRQLLGVRQLCSSEIEPLWACAVVL
eukprot:CAMPEP_0196709576 /NCGR_PEP_ID=MMETSP1090-20130531/68356_1 /TAXON_ID=37098 /ORGANISM="Isochrysis sp, Strain CCMP1244" /LENGTH=64 /DNA_ID=CAMNT_0042049589 /DNA_START=259 /DNA_END=453 /DNA_ORIENTATION=+